MFDESPRKCTASVPYMSKKKKKRRVDITFDSNESGKIYTHPIQTFALLASSPFTCANRLCENH